jgi:DNA-binding response OmpR family regulator
MMTLNVAEGSTASAIERTTFPAQQIFQGKLLVISDMPAVRETLSFVGTSGFDMSFVGPTSNIDAIARSLAVDVALIDLSCGLETCIEFLNTLCQYCMVVVLGGQATTEQDRVTLLESGAEDFLVEGVGKRELVARLRVCLRAARETTRFAHHRGYSFDNWSLNSRSGVLNTPNGASISLTATEMTILIAMLDRPDEVLAREEIINLTRLHAGEVVGRSVDVVIMRLRRKIAAVDPSWGLIKTVRGAGYRLTLDDEAPL